MAKLRAKLLSMSYSPFALHFCPQRCRSRQISWITCVLQTKTVIKRCYINDDNDACIRRDRSFHTQIYYYYYFTPILNSQGVKELCYALQKVQKSSWNEPYSSSFTKQSCSKMALYRWIRSESRVAEIKSRFLCRRPTDQQACDRNLIIIIIIILFTSRNAYKINKHTSIVRRQKGQLRTALWQTITQVKATLKLCAVW